MPRILVDSKIPIYLALSLRTIMQRPHKGRSLFIVPVDSHWNDFGHNLHADLHFVGFPNSPAPLRLRLMVQGHSSIRKFFVEHLNLSEDGKSSIAKIEEIKRPFVSVLSSESEYRKLVDLLGFNAAIGSLRKMHDAVLARLENTEADSSTLELTGTVEFHQGALRGEGTWAAFRQADRYLTPNRPPDVDEAAISFSVEADLRGLEGKHLLDADFGETFPLSRRLLVLVGQNGTGKTRLFKAMIDGLRIVPPWEDTLDLDCAATFGVRPDFSRLIVFSSVASDPYPQSILPWEGIDYRYHRMIASLDKEGGELTMALVDCLRADQEIQGFGRRGALALLNSVLEPLGVSEFLLVELKGAVSTDTLPSTIQIEDRYYFPLLRDLNEERSLELYARINTSQPPIVLTEGGRRRNLSSGEVALLRFAAYAVASLRQGSIFLFDEPETHLHPSYISQFVAILDRILERSGSIALIATHSAYVVREVPRRRVRIITRDPKDENIRIEPPTMQTFGSNIDSISQFVFGDVGPKHRFQQVIKRYIKENPNSTLRQIRQTFEADLNPETLSFIAELLEHRDQK